MHGLEIKDGKAQMAYAKSGGVPWHGLGTEVGDNLTPQKIMEAAGVDWKVRELQTYATMTVGGKKHQIPTGMKALVREDTMEVLTQVGPKWKPVQNEVAFDFFSKFVANGDMSMHTAGSLWDGRIVWALAKVNDAFELFGGDRVESYLLFTNPHQYGKVIDIRSTSCRVVCNNTLNLALSEKSAKSVKVNHRREFDAEEVKALLNTNHNAMESFKEKAEYLGQKQMKKTVVEQYFGDLLGRNKDGKLKRNGELAMQLLETQPGAEYARGTAWNAFNTITYMVDHVMGRENDTRLKSAWYGTGSDLKAKALELALA